MKYAYFQAITQNNPQLFTILSEGQICLVELTP